MLHWVVRGLALAGTLALADGSLADGPVPFNWSGLYAGVTAGAAINHANTELSAVNGGIPNYRPEDTPLLNAIGSGTFTQAGPIVGGRAGYNVQMGTIVLGAEADLSWLRFDKSRIGTGNPFVGEDNPPFYATFVQRASSGWVGTLRGRLGVSLGRALLFATGGLAIGEMSFAYSEREFAFKGLNYGTASGESSSVRTGWAAGGGMEYALTVNWILHAEYLHIDLGSLRTSGLVTSDNAATARHNFTTKLDSDIFRAGISYRF